MQGSAVRVEIRLRKAQDGFLVKTERGYEGYVLSTENQEALHTFYEALFSP
jgi:hypothetical protein